MGFSKPTTPESISDPTREKLVQIQEEFQLDEQKATAIEDKLMDFFNDGYENIGKDVGMLRAYVGELPKGTETGEAWAIDLGGTNLRVCKVVLNGENGKNGKATLEARKYPVSAELKRGTAAELFEYIVDCLDKFMTDLKHPRFEVLPLGLTFSFPINITATNRGTLIKWTKGYDIGDAIGKDVAVLLDDALKKQNLSIRCNALLNDTTGTLVSHAYHTGSCSVGAIFGTGTNGAIVDTVSNITGIEPDHPSEDSMEVVNTEWGGFGERSVLPLTPFDDEVDKLSKNKGSQILEKLISGKYLGEITRHLLLHLIKGKMLFSGYVGSKLDKHYGFESRFVSDIEMDTSEKKGKIREILTNEVEVIMVEGKQIEHSDLEIVLWACQCVGIRAALLSGITMAVAITYTEALPPVSVGIDGAVFLHHPNFKKRLRESLEAVLADDAVLKSGDVKIGIAEDGSSIGAGICALLAARTGPKTIGKKKRVSA